MSLKYKNKCNENNHNNYKNCNVENEELEKLYHNTSTNENNYNSNSNYINNISSNENNLKISYKDNEEKTNANNQYSISQNEESQDDDDKDEVDRILKNMPLTDDITCGYWIFKGRLLQIFANKKAYVALYGLVGCIFSMTYAYFNGTITTLEKRYKIPSRNTGIISVGNDISQLFVSAALSYYAGKGHRPRWIALGLCTIVTFCLLTALPQLIYGSGDDALSLTLEYGASASENITLEILKEHRKKELCRLKGSSALECESNEGNFVPQIILFAAQFISGIGGSLYFTLGVTYMDDNVKKSKTPALVSLSYFLRMLGPAFGYALASFCLRVYISPDLTPAINNNDPRWLGAWWLGWLIMAGLLLFFGFLISMFPRQLPRAAARKMLEIEKDKSLNKHEESELPASFKDMKKTFKRLITNKTLMCNNFASIFYIFGYTPYWIFTPKYIEIQYRQSAAIASLVTGTVALAFSALGILIAGVVLSKYKPNARYMAAWNVVCGVFSVLGIIAYIFLGCPDNEKSVVINISEINSTIPTCNSNCQCDYVRYSPVCGEDGNTYISGCHAGCLDYDTNIGPNGKKLYSNCSCVPLTNNSINLSQNDFKFADVLNKDTGVLSSHTNYGGRAISGACPVDCFKQFVMFLSVMCFLKFIGATGRATNFLVSVRCIPEKDKPAAMGFDLMLMSLFAFIPSPIFFGWVLDKLCLVWGKTCTNKGNCWLYDAKALRYDLNVIASVFVGIGTIFDIGVWYFVKDLNIFDEETKETELKEFHKEKETASLEKKTEI